MNEYTPQPVEVFHTSAAVGPTQIVGTLNGMLSFALKTLLQMLSHRSRQERMQVDPFLKYGFASITVLLHEDATDEEVARGREAVLAAYDQAMQIERPKLSRLVPAGGIGANALIV